jgi:YjjG family noncanonical pyrimidine nucleotidase
LFQHKKHLFFDLDHTLWDFDRNAFDCLSEIYKDFQLEANGIKLEEFFSNFTKVNKALWLALEKNEIEQESIRQQRFKLTLADLNLVIGGKVSSAMNDTFLKLLPNKTKLMEGCIDVLDTLKSKYALHILSNGYAKIQTKKLKNSGILSYFDKVITNDIANFRKPEKGIFDYSLSRAKSIPNEVLMIGDSYLADIIGAKNAGWDTVHFSENHSAEENLSTVKIKQLTELLNYL